MAKVTSNVKQYDWRSIQYLGMLRDSYTDSQFFNNTFAAINGIGYEDTLLLLLNDGASKYVADLKGANVLYAKDLSGAPVISGGSLKYLAIVRESLGNRCMSSR